MNFSVQEIRIMRGIATIINETPLMVGIMDNGWKEIK
jgi:hypothetical protein